MSYSDSFPSSSPVFQSNFAANGGRIDPRMTFTRSDTPPTYAAPSAVHYWSNEKHLSSENLLTHSNPNDAVWSEGGLSITLNQAASPDGTTTASLLTEDSSTGVHRTYISTPVSSGDSLTVVGYLKANSRSIVQVGQTGTYGTGIWVEFDLSGSGSSTTRFGSPTGVSIAQVGSTGWYKVSYNSTTSSSGTHYTQIRLCDSADSVSYVGDNSSGVYAWGFNLSTTGQLVHNATSGQLHRSYASSLKSVTTAGQPRFEYDPSTDGQSVGILIEGQFQQLAQYTEDLSNAYWTKANTTVESNAAVAPDGTLTADLVVETTATGVGHHVRTDNVTGISSSTTYTATVYAKAAGLGFCRLYTNIGAANTGAVFNLSDGTHNVTDGSGTFSSSSVGNGWYRLQMTFTTSNTNNGAVYFHTATDSSTVIYTGNGYGSVLIWGANLTQSSHAYSYLKAEGSATTKAAESLSVATADIGYTGGPVSLVTEFDVDAAAPVGSGVVRRFAMAQLGGTEFGLYQATYGGAALLGVAGGSVLTGSSLTAGANKAALSYDTNDVAICANGGAVTTDTSQELIDASGLNFYVGGETGGASALNGHVKRVALYNEALSDTNLQALTS